MAVFAGDTLLTGAEIICRLWEERLGSYTIHPGDKQRRLVDTAPPRGRPCLALWGDVPLSTGDIQTQQYLSNVFQELYINTAVD